MEDFGYIAYAVDGHCGSKSGNVSAANKTEAEKKVRALYSYPVNIRWDSDVNQLYQNSFMLGSSSVIDDHSK